MRKVRFGKWWLIDPPYQECPVRDNISVEQNVAKVLFVPSGTKCENHNSMANTYTQIHIQTIFAVQNRQSLIQREWQEELYKYITGIVQNNKHKVLQINGMSDHIHLFIGTRPSQSLSNLMKAVKGESSEWINKKGFTKGKFTWQAGYGAFSYAKSQVPKVIRYIQNQEEHHRKKTFTEEYLDFLKAFEIEYDGRFIFKPVV